MESARSIVERFGAHPATALGIDLENDSGLGNWLVASCLSGGRIPDEVAFEAFRALANAGLASPTAVAEAGAEAVFRALEAASHPKAEATAVQLWRASCALGERYAGSLDALADQAEGIEDLAGRIAGLAPGIGAAAVARFLRPLRDRWLLAGEVPLLAPARAAAEHLGLIGEGEDVEGEPGALRAALRDEPGAPPLADVEAALARLGAKSCARNRTDRCPLGSACPARTP